MSNDTIFFSGIFGSVPGEHYRFWPVPGATNCVNLHFFIDIIHDCCYHMIPLVHLKQVNTKNSISYLQYSFKTENCEKLGLLPISSSTIRGNNWYLLEYAIFHV